MQTTLAPAVGETGDVADDATSRADVRRYRFGVALVWLLIAWTVLPRTLQSLTTHKVQGEVGVDTAPAANPLSALTLDLLTVVLLGLCFVIVLDSFTRVDAVPVLGAVALLAPWAYTAVRDLFTGSWPHLDLVIYSAVVLALWRLHLDRRIVAVLGHAVGAVAALSVLMGVLVPSGAILSSELGATVTADKAVGSLGLLAGPFGHSNTLGQFLALGLPAVWLIPRRLTRFLMVAVVVVAVLWSASRTAWIAMIVSVLVAAALLVLPPVLRKLAGAVAVGGAFLVAMALPWLVGDPTAFSGRGIVWLTTRGSISVNPWFGRGSDWFAVVGSTSERVGIAAFSAHNQLLQMLVTGGVLLVVSTVPLMVLAVRGALREVSDGSVWGMVYLAALAGSGVTEAVIKYSNVGVTLPLLAVPLAVLLFAQRRDEGEPEGRPR